MIECEVCSEWFHFKCIGFIGQEKDANNVEFNCYRCERYQKPEEIAERRLKYKAYYDPNFVAKIPEENELGERLDDIENNEKSEEPEPVVVERKKADKTDKAEKADKTSQ